MESSVNITIGAAGNPVSAEMFVGFLANLRATEQINSCRIARHNLTEDITITRVITAANGVSISCFYRMPQQQFIDGLTEWAELALLYIEETPDAWLRNALYISAGRWGKVDHTATDWGTEVVETWLTETYGWLTRTEEAPV